MSCGFGFAGVNSTGKTTLFSTFSDKLDTDIIRVPEATRSDIFSFCNMPAVDLLKAKDKQRVKFYAAQEEMQELREVNSAPKFMSESALPVSLTYLLYLGAQFMSTSDVDSIMQGALHHIQNYYSLIFYLPFGRCPIIRSMHRSFTNPYMLESMDSVLRTVLGWVGQNVEILEVKGSRQSSERFVMSELRKRGYAC